MDEQLWKKAEELFARANETFETFERMGRDGYLITHVTYTTDSTAIPKLPKAPTYSEGFDDGWNARDAAG